MLSTLKKLFSKSPQPEVAPRETRVAPMPTPVSRATTPAQPAAPASAPAGTPADGIPVNLKAVVAMMPDPLKKRLDKNLSGKEMIYVSRGDALRQLPVGSVKLPFSEIVRQSPNLFLPPDAEMAATMVSMPLQEILPHIKTLPRRAAQRQIEVPQDLDPVFGTGAEQSREVKSATQAAPMGSGSRPAPPPPPDESIVIPKPVARPLPPPGPRPLPTPKPPVETASTAYTPPQPKRLEPQAPISFKPPAPVPISAPPVAPAPAAPAPIRLSPTPAAPAPAPTPIPVATPAPAPAPVRVAPAPMPIAPVPVAAAQEPAAAVEPGLSFGDVFGQPQKTEWTMQEIVERTAALRGVAGALITTVDGLPVAFHLPTNLSGNAVAAFIPQMYTRITQYTRDLKLGDAKHLTIFVENVPLQIFRSGSVYFTALGKANENLPKPQLTAIAAALGRPPQS